MPEQNCTASTAASSAASTAVTATPTHAAASPKPPTPAQPRARLVLISGMSGSGKSIALHALEDAGYYCVDNLPPALLHAFFIETCKVQASSLIAISVDARSAASLSVVPEQLAALRASEVEIIPLFLDASNEALMRRFSETRRKHPLTQSGSNNQVQDLHDAIQRERALLADFRESAHVIDTTMTRAAQLRTQIRELLAITRQQLTVVFESFAFKRSVPTDADYVFDVRMLPNPHYEPSLKLLTGRDQGVMDYLAVQPEVGHMLRDIENFLDHWLPAMVRDHRSYVTVAVGCTGGQHRSVYLVEALAENFGAKWPTLKRHRELDGRDALASASRA